MTAAVDESSQLMSETTSFTVDQECICQCEPYGASGEQTCMGANDLNAFAALVWRDATTQNWFIEQSSVGTTPLYKATFAFGENIAGAHSAVGHSLAEPVQTFRATQSAIGCDQGIGGYPHTHAHTRARAHTHTHRTRVESYTCTLTHTGASNCLPLCAAYGIDSSQLVAKCNLTTEGQVKQVLAS